MKIGNYLFTFITSGMILLGIFHCTSNPFGEDNISSGAREITGRVELDDNSTPEGIYVWLEEFNLGEYTDQNGEFTITLPPGTNEQGSGINGTFNLYFYMANYELQTAEVVVHDNEFVYSKADINKNGHLRTTIQLKKFLQINTEIEPSSIQQNYSQLIEVDVTLSATQDTATVLINTYLASQLGAILLKDKNNDNIFIFGSNAKADNKLLITKANTTLHFAFSLLYTSLPQGEYKVIPYLLMRHQNIPDALINSLGNNVEGCNVNYLNIPFERQGGILEVL